MRSTLHEADLVFGNCETPYSERGSPIPKSGAAVAIKSHPRCLPSLGAAGFHLMSFANNHCMDYGPEAFLDTVTALRENGVTPVGAGKNLAEARQPVVVERNGNRVAFLAYAAVMWPGTEAAQGRPGCAPMRIHTVYRDMEAHQPGSVPDILTFADRDHLAMMREDIQRARSLAPVVVLSFHWGIHFTPVVLAMYESEVARAAIDAGADLILGHHQHVVKGIQVYRGKVIFHGLGNFASSRVRRASVDPAIVDALRKRYPDQFGDDSGHRSSGAELHPTMIAKVTITGGKIARVGFLPCVVGAAGAPEVCPAPDKRFSLASGYVSRVTSEAGFPTQFRVEGGEVIVKA